MEALIEDSLPYSPEVLYQYILPEAPRRNHKTSTAAREVAAIGATHRWLRYPDRAAAHTLKINTRGRSAKQPKAPLPYSVIERALPTYAEDGTDVGHGAMVSRAQRVSSGAS